jgi:CheY-like chemotaxis protein
MAKIMIIDDDQVLLKLYSTKLIADKHIVETATNGEEGLQKLAAFKPDVIVLDLLMPKLNGFAFIEEVKKYPASAKIPIIIFSSVANQEQLTRLEKMGITTYLNKIDTSPTQLVSSINQILTNSPAPPSAA